MTGTINGRILAGARDLDSAARFHAINPASDDRLEPAFSEAGPQHVAEAAGLAEKAFPVFRNTPPGQRADLLDAIAEKIEALGDKLIERACQETGLPTLRLQGERARTVGQLRFLAEWIRRGGADEPRIDPALPARKPQPRPDIRLRHIGIGPVAVFGASNFPLAFSVAGGDTASALAAGCPVIVKGHPAHPGTSEFVGRAIRDAVAEAGLPAGVFSLLTGTSNTLGAALVADPRIQAVGFTGSRAGGLALGRIAAERPVPIPVYAEMSSINPVFLLPAALSDRPEALATDFVASLALGAGQFCTNPGILVAQEGAALQRFLEAAAEALRATAPATMLTPGIAAAYRQGVSSFAAHPAVRQVAVGPETAESNACRATLFATDANSFCSAPELSHEVFGACALLVRCADEDEMVGVAEALEGQLTATIHLAAADHPFARVLLPILETRAGRILANGWPTGVEVCHAMVHGGPFPATSDPRTTSVGTLSIRRFLRPVCYQGLPDALLPASLQADNPFRLARCVDGVHQPAPADA